MRILSEIIEDMRNGEKPTHDECYHALQVYRVMFDTEHRLLRNELIDKRRTPEAIRKMKAQGSFDMYNGALSKSPEEWMGRNRVKR